MPSYLNTFIIQFDSELAPYEVSAFRGGILASMGGNADVLFHNHRNEGFRYSYPLIQYKRINRRAAIVCIGEGTEIIGQFLSKSGADIKIGDRTVVPQIESMRPSRTLIQIWNDRFTYTLRNWVSLNSGNYQQYSQTAGLVDQVQMLQKILVGNILSFAKGVGIEIEGQIECEISKILHTQWKKIKGEKILTFDVEFSANISLPDYIGLGKHTSLGHGTIRKKYEK